MLKILIETFINLTYICIYKLYISDWCCTYRTGGIELTAPNGKIKVVNTLESRLELISKQVKKTSISRLFVNLPIADVAGRKRCQGLKFLPALYGISGKLFHEKIVSNALIYSKLMLYETCVSIAGAHTYAVQTGLCEVSRAYIA